MEPMQLGMTQERTAAVGPLPRNGARGLVVVARKHSIS
jgi:hypothetical protein